MENFPVNIGTLCNVYSCLQAQVYRKPGNPPELYSGTSRSKKGVAKDPDSSGKRSNGSDAEEKQKYSHIDHHW